MIDLREWRTGLLDDWQVKRSELNYVVAQNPSLRGMLFGYVAELKLEEQLRDVPGVSEIQKFDDHDREHKHDRRLLYKGRAVTVESKSLQTKTVEHVKRGSKRWQKFAGAEQTPPDFPPEEGFWYGKAQVDASDRREVTLPDGSTKETTCLVKGEFDLLAVNVFAFTGEWDFAYAKNEDLPTSTYHDYTEYEQQHLLKSLHEVTWPPTPPFYEDIEPLLDEIIS